MVLLEKSFPRGGTIQNYQSHHGKPLVFGAIQKKNKKQRQKSNKDSNDTEQVVKSKSSSADLLTLDTMQEGMLLMGIVKSINQLFIKVSLPGCITATISALDISDAYSKTMNLAVENSTIMAKDYKPLTELFYIGQIIYGKVKEMKRCDTGHVIVNMSLKPSDVHAELNYMKIQMGFTFNGAIAEIQDHGYIVESGISGLRCFVPSNKSLSEHTIGELIHLKVFHLNSDKNAAICKCKEISINEFQVNKQASFGLDSLMPSTIVQFKVTKHLRNGLEGLIVNENLIAYTNEHHLITPLTLTKEIKLNSIYNARILYVMPLTKMIYLQLNTMSVRPCSVLLKSRLNRGDVIEAATVLHTDAGGIILLLNDNFKGLLSFKTIKSNYKGNYDTDEMIAKYVKDSKHKIRILGYSEMDALYTCSDDVSTINEKYFNIEDLKLGGFVKGVVEAPLNKVDGFLIRLGKLRGVIEKFYLAPKRLEINSKIKCRIIDINIERKTVYLTNRKEYLAKDCPLLTSIEMAEIDHMAYMGTVVNASYSSYILVKFLGSVKGVLYKDMNNACTTNLMEGQTMLFRIKEKKEEQLILDFLYTQFQLGDICRATFVNRLETALEISVSACKGRTNHNAIKAIVPIRLISDFSDLLRAKMLMYAFDDQLQAACISDNIFSLRDVKYFTERNLLEWQDLQIGDILRAFVKNVDDDIIEITLPLRDYKNIVKFHSKMLLMNAYDMRNITLTPEQVIYVKILGKNNATKTLSVSAKLTDVWQGLLTTTGIYCESYLNEVMEVKAGFKKCGHPIADYSYGQKVMARFQCVNENTNDWQYLISKTKITGIVKQWMVAKQRIPEKDARQECLVIWVDYSNAIVYLSNVSSDSEHVSDKENISENLVDKAGISAKVLFKNDTIFICSLKKGNNPLIICPTRLHYNDVENIGSGTLAEGEFCELAFIYGKKPIAVLNSVYLLWHSKRKRKLTEKQDELLKAKRVKTNTAKPKSLPETAKLEANDVAPTSVKKKKTQAKLNLQCRKTKEKKNQVINDEQLLYVCDKVGDKEILKNYSKDEVQLLPGIGGFWDANLPTFNDCDQNSDEDEEDEATEETQQDVKRKLSAVERFKLQRLEEARLRDIEEKNADPNNIPNTVDQFDRLVLAEPNSSKHWISYMVYYLQSTEIDKARAVARRALKTISFRDNDDQLNIWVALLNLELRYGTKSSFDDTLKEALTLNDPLKVYLRTIDILTEARKTEELLALIGVVTKKLKLEQQMWRTVANALFAIGMVERAQQVLHKALSCLPERDHVNTIVMFAALNHQYGNAEMAQTLLDQVVTSYPKRVDVWSQYVDMLVKDGLVDSARNVLERAVVQNLPLKKMRVLFKKYLEFEERFGTDSNVQRVKALAVNYVKKAAKI